MTNEKAIETIKTAIAEVEWNYPMDYADAFEMAIEALENCPPKDSICYGCKDNCNKCEAQKMLMV